MNNTSKPNRPRGCLSRIVRRLRDLTDVHRQAEINRLVTRAGRRCARDFSHAIAHIPEGDPSKVIYQQRVSMWKDAFWDCAAYRDGMHHEIWGLESKVEKLEKQLRDAGIEPVTELPFQLNANVDLPEVAAAVAHHRVKAQIPSFHNARKKVVWAPQQLAMLGDVPDEEVAALMQIHKDTVAAKRRMIGKAKFICR